MADSTDPSLPVDPLRSIASAGPDPSSASASSGIDSPTASARSKPDRPTEPPIAPTTELQFLKGVGPKRAELFARLGLRNARDLLFNFPRAYETLEPTTRPEDLVEKQPATIAGNVTLIETKISRSGMHILGIVIDCGSMKVRSTWFNQSFLRSKLAEGFRVLVSGKPRLEGVRWAFVNPKLIVLREDEPQPEGQILPVYRLTEGLAQHHVRRASQRALEACVDGIDEVMPQRLLDQWRIVDIRRALRGIHQPADADELAAARRRLVFQELVVLQLALAMRRRKLLAECRAPALPVDSVIDARIVRLFPFDLTEDQRRAIDEIAADMGRAVPMNRLLQGDVGVGKTIVAFYAMLLAVAHKHQAVLMAPTEILATQHLKGLRRLLSLAKIDVGVLTGSTSDAERKRTLAGIADGSIPLIVGTHALIQQPIPFDRLGLVIVDEQHKFGVKQRAMLRQAGIDPHYLVMTATPIPRTMTMTAFGDLDVSTLRHGPPNRQPLHTYLGNAEQRDKWWTFFRKKLDEGRQGYVITPLVDDADDGNLTSVKTAFENLTNDVLADYRVDLLHGRQSAVEKGDAMFRFATGETQVLVSTSVVEVGVDVPNATVMTIESAERFGLSQLHQLRGRVARGNHPGYVCAFAEIGNEQAQQRLDAFVGTTDGFELAEIDFRLRGPGDLLGTRQSGLPPLRIADLIRDAEVVAEAREGAIRLLEHDKDLTSPDCERLRRQVLVRYGKVLELGDVG